MSELREKVYDILREELYELPSDPAMTKLITLIRTATLDEVNNNIEANPLEPEVYANGNPVAVTMHYLNGWKHCKKSIKNIIDNLRGSDEAM